VNKCFSIFLPLIALALAGCGSLLGESREEYLDARTIEPIEVPAGLNKEALGQVYRVSQDNVIEQNTTFKLTPPPSLVARSNIEKVSLQRLADKQWILVAQSTADTWPQIIRFMRANQLPISSTDIAQSALETAWLPLAIDPGFENQYRITVEQGLQSNTTEVHVAHRRRQQGIAGAEQWPSTSVDKLRESWMLNELALGLASSDLLSGDSLQAHNIGGVPKVAVRQQDGEPVLAFLLDQQRTLASLSYALTKGQFELYQQDDQQKVFYINYTQEKKKKSGWFSSLRLSNILSSTPQQYSLEQLLSHLPASDPGVEALFPTLSNSNPPLKNVPGYLVVVRTQQQQQYVYVRDGHGKILDPADAQRLLVAIRQQLI